MSFASTLASAKKSLKHTDVSHEHTSQLKNEKFKIHQEKHQESILEAKKTVNLVDTDEVADYFYNSGIQMWYEHVKEYTFPCEFVDIGDEERLELFFDFHKSLEVGGRDGYKMDRETKREHELIFKNAGFDINIRENSSEKLKTLEDRITKVMSKMREERNLDPKSSFYIKLSTRSPKDSKLVFKRAVESTKTKLQSLKNSGHQINENKKWSILNEEMRLACQCWDGQDAVKILRDSERVGEDLKLILDRKYVKNFSRSLQAGSEELLPDLPLCLVIRPFDQRITPSTEFRGFVWGGKLTCIGQYFYQLYFEGLADKKDKISKDLQDFYNNKIRPKLFIPNDNNCFGYKTPSFMMDLVWIDHNVGPILTEINPFDGESLGTMKGSTGLFDFMDIDGDRQLLMGKRGDFVMRLVEKESENFIMEIGPAFLKKLLI